MKKLLFSLFIVSLATSKVLAQDDGDKKVKMGIMITPALNWLAPDNDKKMSNDGMVMKMGIGLAVDFRLTDVIWFHTGLEYTGAGGKIKYGSSGNTLDTAGYYYKDDAILAVTPNDANSLTSQANQDVAAGKSKTYQLMTRNYKTGYLHIPLGFKLKTKELGGITYFGDIGGDLFIKTSSKGNDHVNYRNPATGVSSQSDIDNNKLTSEVNLINGSAHVGFGAEYRLSGSTALFGSLQYRHGIMNYTNNGTDKLLRYTATNGSSPFSQFPNDAKLRQVVLTLGVMF
jgi:hypothetical protein